MSTDARVAAPSTLEENTNTARLSLTIHRAEHEQVVKPNALLENLLKHAHVKNKL